MTAPEPARASEAVLARLLKLHPKLIDLSLDRVLRLLDRLGRPQDRVPPVIHVAGTNGKGSVVAYLRAMLEAAGYRSHAYTSPHLVRFHERIRLAGELIGEEQLVDVLEECERVNAGEQITFFEITTAAAFLAFARSAADALLLEVGMGGRLDTTNVVAHPAVTAVTPISMDHMDHLGNTLAAIAGEKAGIFKADAPAVIAPQPEEVLRVLERRAWALHAPLFRSGAEWRADATGAGMRYAGRRFTLELPPPALPGAHQVVNAATAIACLDVAERFAVSPAHIAEGLRTVTWPARLQRLRRGPLVDVLPQGWELWLDGGHNEGAGRALAEFATGWRDRELHLIYGMLSTKQPRAFLRPLAPYVASLEAVRIPASEASLSAEQSAAAAREAGIDAKPAPDLAAALRAIVKGARAPGRILICGSLYLAGTVLAENG